MKRINLIICCLCFCKLCVWANIVTDIEDIEQYIVEILEHYAEESGEDLSIELILEELITLAEHPIDLNRAEREDLENLVFLSDLQIENLLYYRYTVGAFEHIYELSLIEGFDMTDIRRIINFVQILERQETTIKAIDFKKALKYGKHDIFTRMDFSFEKKDGYIKDEDGNATYLGLPCYHHIKYKYHYQDRLYINFTVEQDAGEPYWNTRYQPYDYLSASIQLKDYGHLKNLIVGDYQVCFGQGLGIRQTYNLGKSAMATNIGVGEQGFKRYGSTNEFNFMRGIASSWQWRKTQLHAFYSNRMMDGTLQDDGSISSFYTTGYHRTTNEISKQNTFRQQVAGVSVNTRNHWCQVGLQTSASFLNNTINPKYYPYNHHYFREDKQWVSSLYYRMRLLKFNLFGEFALTDFKSPAMLNGLTCTPVSKLSLAVLHRYIPPDYTAILASSFGASSSVTNEHGFYLGTEVLPFKNWKLAFYTDVYSFPWLRYGVDFPSHGTDCLLQLNYAPKRNLNLQLRAKYKRAMNNPSGSQEVIPVLIAKDKLNLRLQSVFETGKVKFKTLIDGNQLFINERASTYGIGALQEVSFRFEKIPLKVDLSYFVFDAIDYDNRLYIYEKDVLYAFSVPAFSGLGCKYYVNLRYDFSSKISCWLKLSQLHYTDGRDKVGSGYESIIGDRRTDCRWLLRIKL